MPGIYIHIPFCRQACIYCNFYFQTGSKQVETVVDAICREIEMRKGECSGIVETIYFGGGTPSYVPAEAIAEIIETIRKNYTVAEKIELTLEANPDDITVDKLKRWKSEGVNRLSIGVQSFFDRDLKWMNRAHNAVEAENCIRMAMAEGFEVSADLIFGLPGSSDEIWEQNLVRVNELGVHHLSCYGLTLEENTGWMKLIERKKYKGPDESATALQFRYTMDFLEKNGWDHYEISNYCRPGYEAKHNSSYWKDRDYLGFGPAAHSYNGTQRQWNVADNRTFVESVMNGILPFESEILTPENKFNEYLMTGLRTKWGIDTNKVMEMGFYDEVFKEKITGYLDKLFLQQSGSTISLTKEGMVYADAIASDFFQ